MIEYHILSLVVGVAILVVISRAAGFRKLSDIEIDKDMLQVLGFGAMSFGLIAIFFYVALG